MNVQPMMRDDFRHWAQHVRGGNPHPQFLRIFSNIQIYNIFKRVESTHFADFRVDMLAVRKMQNFKKVGQKLQLYFGRFWTKVRQIF